MENSVYELIIKELNKILEVSNSISGDIFGCVKIYNKYENEVSRYEFLDILKNIKNCNGKEPNNLEHVICIFNNDNELNNFREKNKDSIETYMEADWEF